MTDVSFREKQEPAVESVGVGKETTQSTITQVEPPFLDYSREHGQPFVVSHFNIGDRWQGSPGGFSTEVAFIESYLEKAVPLILVDGEKPVLSLSPAKAVNPDGWLEV